MKGLVASPNIVERKWYVVDADGATLGRLASEVVAVLRGKNKPILTPYVDCGSYIVATNANKIAVTGEKLDQKVHYSHPLYIDGMKEAMPRELETKESEKAIGNVVKGAFSKGPLGAQTYKRLYAYTGENHDHQVQKPEVLTIKG